MALKTCPNCGKLISDKAKVCPKCGMENPFEAEEAVYKPVATFILALTPSEFYKIPADTTLLFTNLKPHNKRETAIRTNVTI